MSLEQQLEESRSLNRGLADLLKRSATLMDHLTEGLLNSDRAEVEALNEQIGAAIKSIRPID